MDVIGPASPLWRGASSNPGDGSWQRAWLYYQASSIFAGTNEIQRSVIGERVLGLPANLRHTPAGRSDPMATDKSPGDSEVGGAGPVEPVEPVEWPVEPVEPVVLYERRRGRRHHHLEPPESGERSGHRSHKRTR